MKMPESPLNILSRRLLRQLTDERSYVRGEAYFRQGRVRAMAEFEGALTASVRGTRDYKVRLWVEGDSVESSCTCPFAVEGWFCKHCVAVGLAWVAEAEGEDGAGGARKPTSVMGDLRAFLDRQDKSRLVELLLREALEDEGVRERLLLEAARANPGRPDVDAYRRAIGNAVSAGGFVDYDSAGDYARGIGRVVEFVAALLDDGRATEVVELAEHALSELEAAMDFVDDSGGYMTGVLRELHELHHAACLKAKPGPEELARRLFRWELTSRWGFFSGAAEAYAEVLGEEGLAAYRRLAEAEWARLPALGPRDARASHGVRFRLTHVMETLARQSGDVESLVEIKSRDLSRPDAFLEVAEIYQEAGRNDEALVWAERGMKAFPEGPDWRLGEFLADEYHRRGRHDEAMSLIWRQFAESPRLDNYRHLRAHARKTARPSEWKQWREKALGHLRAAVERQKKQAGRSKIGWHDGVDHSELVRISLWEKRYEDAWREAQEGGCSGELWLELAVARERLHPENALVAYRSQVAPTVEQTNSTAYEQAVRLLRKVRELLARLGRAAEFDDYLTALRVEYKRKRTFIKLLESLR